MRYREWKEEGVLEGEAGIFHKQAHECVNTACTDDVHRFCMDCAQPNVNGHKCAESVSKIQEVGLNVLFEEGSVQKWEESHPALMAAFHQEQKLNGVLDLPMTEALKDLQA
jgi:hypothetical protein